MKWAGRLDGGNSASEGSLDIVDPEALEKFFGQFHWGFQATLRLNPQVNFATLLFLDDADGRRGAVSVDRLKLKQGLQS